MPQVRADFLHQRDAVARVGQRAQRGAMRQSQIVFDHLGVVLEPAAREHHAVARADQPLLSPTLDFDAHDGPRLRILHQARNGRLEPHVDLVFQGRDAIALHLPHIAVRVALVQRGHGNLVRTGKLGILRRHEGECGTQLIHVAEVFDVQTVPGRVFVLEAGEALDERVRHVVGHRQGPAQGREVIARRLLVAVAVHERLTAITRIAAFVTERSLVEQQHGRARLRRRLRRNRAGGAEAHDHHVVLAVPSNRLGEIVLAFLGGCLRRACGKRARPHHARTGNGEPFQEIAPSERLAHDFFHHVPSSQAEYVRSTQPASNGCADEFADDRTLSRKRQVENRDGVLNFVFPDRSIRPHA